MKKVLAIVVVVVLLAITGYLWNRRNTSQPNESTTNTAPISENTAPQTKDTSSVIGSIKDAMGLGKKLRCTYSDTTGTGATSTVFIDGQKVKFSTTVNGETSNGIFDGETQYIWTTGKTNNGFKMTKACMDEMKDFASKMSSGNTPETTPMKDYSSFDDAKNINCESAENEDFSVPATIEFVDQCEMLRNSMKALDQMKQGMPQVPQGVNMPSIPSSY